ncbi:hypothetical protein K443DRAFT_13421 [Laccaria amethystina LaAM-08-1]|uniref:Uncharacterized protein n=1 Tax=Laccaria amethystina LaAM-08-1 TaxID=1095629 RepID=A0A0C9WPA3_9AGAR|nr:hypothetical protein K443DRAFT_13421 [Laccaria amethystina LaAM-08-1]
MSLPSFLANNPNFESNLNTPLNLSYVVRDGILNAGTNSLPFPRTRMSSAPDADGEMKKREGERVSFDSTGGRASGVGSLLTIWSVGQALCSSQEEAIPYRPVLLFVHHQH